MTTVTLPENKWMHLTGEQLRPCVADRALLVYFGPRRGNRDRMPMVSANARFPGRKTPLCGGFVTAVTRDGLRCRIESDHGHRFWIDVDLLTFELDRL